MLCRRVSFSMYYKNHINNPKNFRSLSNLIGFSCSQFLLLFSVHDDYLFEYEMNDKHRSQYRGFCIYKNNPLPSVEERLSEFSLRNSISMLLHDETEREICRSVDYDNQKEKYNGKRKRHTVTNCCNHPIFCLISFPSPCTLYQDGGYQSYRLDGVNIVPTYQEKERKAFQ